MFKNRKINILLQLISLSVILVITIGFVGKKQQSKTVKSIIINIENRQGHYFIVEQDILSIMNSVDEPYILGAEWSQISLKKIEKRIKTHKFVEEIEAFRDLEGNMIIEVKQCFPIARIVSGSGSGYYITDKGKIIPLSERFTARVMTLDGTYFNEIEQNEAFHLEETPLFEMINFIRNDKFWNAQIAHINIDKNAEILMYPQVSKQYIEFGDTENYVDKFKKLKIFYEKILPQKGWNNYERVNVKYKGQIVCE